MDIWVVFKIVGIFEGELKEFVGGEAVTYYERQSHRRHPDFTSSEKMEFPIAEMRNTAGSE